MNYDVDGVPGEDNCLYPLACLKMYVIGQVSFFLFYLPVLVFAPSCSQSNEDAPRKTTVNRSYRLCTNTIAGLSSSSCEHARSGRCLPRVFGGGVPFTGA
jgi:hypothetical protein